MKPIVVCNWKTYISSDTDAIELINAIKMVDTATLIICPSAIHLSVVQKQNSQSILGAQDISTQQEKPQTGRSSGEQLRDAGVGAVLVGHSETRTNGVSNIMVATKTLHALSHDISPIICLSEQKAEIDEEGNEVLAQLEEILSVVAPQYTMQNCIIAYEPTAYIGKSTTPTPEAIQRVHARLQQAIQKHTTTTIPVIYGGSVTKENVGGILQQNSVSGVLLGRAGSQADSLNTILQSI